MHAGLLPGLPLSHCWLQRSLCSWLRDTISRGLPFPMGIMGISLSAESRSFPMGRTDILLCSSPGWSSRTSSTWELGTNFLHSPSSTSSVAPQKSESSALLLCFSDQALFSRGSSPTGYGIWDETERHVALERRAAVDENVLATFTHTAVAAES